MKMCNLSVRVTCLSMAFLLFELSEQQQQPRVETKVGVILGKDRTSATGKKIYSFTGIPYIKPPVEELRFKPPIPAEPFKKEFNATDEMITCKQTKTFNYYGTEDCVILSVFTPWNPSSSSPEKPLAVMVYIHFGGFIQGSSSHMAVGFPDYLLERDVILVTLNYRLGVFGFLSTGDEEAPGNYGMLDQVEALKWIKNNIAAFGGNPDKVTVFGSSSGGISAHLLMLSPLTKGLLHRAIVQSGTAVASWAKTSLSSQHSRALAEKLNCPTSSSSELLDCLRGKSTEELVKTDPVDNNERLSDHIPIVWAPRIDRESEYPFLPDHPINIMTSGRYNKVPLLIGHTKDELVSEVFGPARGMYGFNETDATKMRTKFLKLCPLALGFQDLMLSEEESEDWCNRIIDYYVNTEDGFEDNKLQIAKLSSDMGIIAGVYKSIELMADQSPVYCYSFNYENGKTWLMKMFIPQFHYVKGYVPHMDDILYLFKYPKIKWPTDSLEYQIVDAMTKAWTEFAKTGKPVLPNLDEPWPRASPEKSKYVVIDDVATVEEAYRPKDMEFVDSIYSQTLYKEPNRAGSAHVLKGFPILTTILLIILLA